MFDLSNNNCLSWIEEKNRNLCLPQLGFSEYHAKETKRNQTANYKDKAVACSNYPLLQNSGSIVRAPVYLYIVRFQAMQNQMRYHETLTSIYAEGQQTTARLLESIHFVFDRFYTMLFWLGSHIGFEAQDGCLCPTSERLTQCSHPWSLWCPVWRTLQLGSTAFATLRLAEPSVDQANLALMEQLI
eukprot:3417842-Amphidinium_carterae.1